MTSKSMDSKAQRKQENENKERMKKAPPIIQEKKLEGPNRPST